MAGACVFKRVILIGYGQIVNNCLKTLKELSESYGYALTYIEYEKTDLSTSVEFCKKEEIEYASIYEKDAVSKYFLSIDDNTLIISAGNFYIFPKEVVKKQNFTIINFHSALLPKYPGRNAQSWAIFCGEKEAGATWHFVNEEIDAGKYIVKKATPITENTKAYELTGAIMDVAYEGFLEIIEGVLTDKYDKVWDISINSNRKVYKGRDIPGDGCFSLDDNPEYIYRLLRSIDYGKSDIFPNAKTIVNNKTVIIKSYKVIENDGITQTTIDDKSILIPYDDRVLRLKYKEEQ